MCCPEMPKWAAMLHDDLPGPVGDVAIQQEQGRMGI